MDITTLIVQNGGGFELGAFTDIYTYVLAFVSSALMAGLAVFTNWKEKFYTVAGGDTTLGKFLKALQPIGVMVIALGAGALSNVLGLDATLARDCLVGGVDCSLFADAAGAALLAIPIREMLARAPIASMLFAK